MISAQRCKTVSAGPTDYVLGDRFWQDFVANHWTGGPVVIKRPFAQPMIEAEQVFALLKQASADRRARRPAPMVAIVDDGSRERNLTEFLPTDDDADLAAFQHRMDGELGDVSRLLIAYGTHRYDAQLWDRLRRFLQPLYRIVGAPASKVDTDVFLGRYSRTPSGIHRDAVANFGFVLAGTKRMLVWPRDAFDEKQTHLNITDWRPHADRAIELVGEPGDIIFWPPDYWHIAVSDNRWQFTFNLSLYVKRLPFTLVDAALAPYKQRLARQTPELAQDTYELRDLLQAPLPSALAAEVAAFRELVSGPQFEEAVTRRWLRHASGAAFSEVPAMLAAADLRPNDVIVADPEFPVLWSRSGAVDIIAANGSSLAIAAMSTTRELIVRLNSGQPARVADLVQLATAADVAAEEVMELLTYLLRMRAFTVRPH